MYHSQIQFNIASIITMINIKDTSVCVIFYSFLLYAFLYWWASIQSVTQGLLWFFPYNGEVTHTYIPSHHAMVNSRTLLISMELPLSCSGLCLCNLLLSLPAVLKYQTYILDAVTSTYPFCPLARWWLSMSCTMYL